MEKELRGALEEGVLTVLCYSETHAAKVSIAVTPETFSTRPYRRIAEAAIDHLDRYNRPIRIHLREVFDSDLQKGGSDGKFLESVISSMEGLEAEIQSEKIVDRLDYFLKTRRLAEAIDKASDFIQAGDLENAKESLFGIDILERKLEGVWLRDTDKWFSFLENKNKERGFSCGIDLLDEEGYNVRLRRGELLLFIAATGRGKSWYLIEVAKRALRDKKKVLHISLENSLELTQERYTQSFLRLRNNKKGAHLITLFTKDRRNNDQLVSVDRESVESRGLLEISKKELQRRLEEEWGGKGQLRVDWFPAGFLTVQHLRAHLESLEKLEGFIPEVVCLDFLDQMFIDSRNFRIDTGRVIKDLRGLAGMRNFALFTATQGNRSSADARLVTSSHVGEDWSKIGTSDIVLTYSQTQEEKEKGIARILVDKARNSPDKFIIWIAQNYSTGQFCLDSVYFNALTSGEVRRYVNPEDDED